MKNILLSVILVFFSAASALYAQNQEPMPRLIVGIVIDQMRYDYLYRFQNNYGPDGFKRLLRDGFSCENTNYTYIPTYTGPGHACVYTGTYPSVNGIIANDWYDPEWGKHRYVTTDTKTRPIGTQDTTIGRHSPKVLLSSTVTDELRLFSNFRSKVVGIAMKDRGSVLPAGHIPNACYWYDHKAGNWVTSSYYPDSIQLPTWVRDFNAKKLPEQYLSKPWTKLPGLNYTASFANWDKYDDARYEKIPGGMPHDLPALRKNVGLGVIRFTPFGNTLTMDFALEAIDKMQLGADENTDFLAVSFSSTDYVGHQFGIHSEELEDTYIRLDAEIARLLKLLDQRFGSNRVLVFLTADHGACETPAHLEDMEMPAGVFTESIQDTMLENELSRAMGVSGKFIKEVYNQQIWFDRAALHAANIPFELACELVAGFIRRQPGVYDAYSRGQIMMLPESYPYAAALRRGIHPRRSGDVIYQLDPAWHSDDHLFATGGTTHGSSYKYDTHVPLLWYGWRIKPGETIQPVDVADIAPTVSALLRIPQPSGAMGKPIEAIFNK